MDDLIRLAALKDVLEVDYQRVKQSLRDEKRNYLKVSPFVDFPALVLAAAVVVLGPSIRPEHRGSVLQLADKRFRKGLDVVMPLKTIPDRLRIFLSIPIIAGEEPSIRYKSGDRPGLDLDLTDFAQKLDARIQRLARDSQWRRGNLIEVRAEWS